MITQEKAMNMSNEQAVQILIPMRNMMCDQNGCPISDAVFALDKAIEALSADRPQEKMSDPIRREDAIGAINGWLKQNGFPNLGDGILYLVPSTDRPQEWIPCSERMPKPYTEVLVCDECGWISLGTYRPCDVTEKDSGWSTLTRIKMPTDEVFAWMPLPDPWKGADDEKST